MVSLGKARHPTPAEGLSGFARYRMTFGHIGELGSQRSLVILHDINGKIDWRTTLSCGLIAFQMGLENGAAILRKQAASLRRPAAERLNQLSFFVRRTR
jgi:hypothetical protein